MYSLELRLDLKGDRKLFERIPKRLRNPRYLMRAIGVYALGQAVYRLENVLTMGENTIRTGRLGASLQVGGAETVFELAHTRVVVGSNVPYAAQVQFGGRIEPKSGKALAIPLINALKRNQIWPSELDPQRELLDFMPASGGASGNVIGILIDPENALGFGEEPLYALAQYVDQEPRPYLYFDHKDRQVINDELFPAWLRLAGPGSLSRLVGGGHEGAEDQGDEGSS